MATTTEVNLHPLGMIHGPQPRPSNEESSTTNSLMKRASLEMLLGTASDVMTDVVKASNVFDASMEAQNPRFHANDVSLGCIISKGRFSVVRNVERIHNITTNTNAKEEESPSSKNTTFHGPRKSKSGFSFPIYRGRDNNKSKSLNESSECRGNKDGFPSSRQSNDTAKSKKTNSNSNEDYVMKSVAKNLGKYEFMKGTAEIALEAKFLSILKHNNIIKLVGVSEAEPCTLGYFLILEKTIETLTQRIKAWTEQDRRLNKKSFTRMMFIRENTKEKERMYRERTEACYDIACGLHYLHSKNIIYRDLKPDNIGFDSSGVLKLTDFGLAKELLNKDRREDGTYRNLTARTGDFRYMAPEVGLGKPYNLTADVYSWSMLTWFILSLEQPFSMYTERMIKDRVMVKGERPVIDTQWNEIIGDALECCWDSNISARPSFLEIKLFLWGELLNGETEDTVAESSSISSSYGDAILVPTNSNKDDHDDHSSISSCSDDDYGFPVPTDLYVED